MEHQGLVDLVVFHLGGAPLGAAESATEGEHLLILRMLEQKKISIAEAEQLLAALEGKQP